MRYVTPSGFFHIPDMSPIPSHRLTLVSFFQACMGKLYPYCVGAGSRINTNCVDLAYVLDQKGVFDHTSRISVLVKPIEGATFNSRYRYVEPFLTIAAETISPGVVQASSDTLIVPLGGTSVRVSIN